MKERRKMNLEDFMYRVWECHFTNLETYPEENPTLDGAFREVLDLVVQEHIDEAKGTTQC